jgi:hypothetical protein
MPADSAKWYREQFSQEINVTIGDFLDCWLVHIFTQIFIAEMFTKKLK